MNFRSIPAERQNRLVFNCLTHKIRPQNYGRKPGELALVIFTVYNHRLKLHVVHLVAQF